MPLSSTRAPAQGSLSHTEVVLLCLESHLPLHRAEIQTISTYLCPPSMPPFSTAVSITLLPTSLLSSPFPFHISKLTEARPCR